MEESLKVLQTRLLSVVSIIVGLVGLVMAYVFYRRSRRAKEPCWAIRTRNLIAGSDSRLNDLEVLFKGHGVQDLWVSRVAFWNEGAETINRADLVATNPAG